MSRRSWRRFKRTGQSSSWRLSCRNRPARVACKLLLNLSILALLGFLVWFGLQLFTQRTPMTPVQGSLVFIASLAVFIFLCRVGLRTRWRPSMKVTVLSLVVLFVITSLAGVQPMSSYMDAILHRAAELPTPSRYDAPIPPSSVNEKVVCDDWCFEISGGGWRGGTLTVDLTITNLGSRRNLGVFGYGGQYDLVAIDDTGKVVSPQPLKDTLSTPYAGEFYPDESWSGQLVFSLSSYSGRTMLWLTEYSMWRKAYLFYLGEPS